MESLGALFLTPNESSAQKRHHNYPETHVCFVVCVSAIPCTALRPWPRAFPFLSTSVLCEPASGRSHAGLYRVLNGVAWVSARVRVRAASP